MAKTTMMFEFDIRTHRGNPLDNVTLWGKPSIIAVGDVFAERDRLQEALHRYGRHHAFCPTTRGHAIGDPLPICECGLDAVTSESNTPDSEAK